MVYATIYLNLIENIKRVILTSALKVLIKNPVKESFYKKKKTINILTAFFISHKNDIKIFLKWIVNQCPKGTC